MPLPRILAIVLAGGQGSRLKDLTATRVKPALPVGGSYRLVDVALSNLAHSHISDVWIVEQYLPHSLNDHLAQGRPWDLDRMHGGLQVLHPFEGGPGEGFAQGNSDSLWRQRERIGAFDPELVLVLSADHLYLCDFLSVVETHTRMAAELTMVTTRTDTDPGTHAVVQSTDGWVTGFDYKPDEPDGDTVAAEIFLFDTATLLAAFDALLADRERLGDYGEDLIPWFVARGKVAEHPLDSYWMDLGTLQTYWTAHMQLLDGDGAVLDDPQWPIYTAQPQLLPARIEDGAEVADSLVSAGSTIAGTVRHSVIGPGAVVEAGAEVVDSVVLDGTRIGSGVTLVQCIVDIGAEVSRGGQRGTNSSITLIGADGKVATRDELDPASALPSSFRRSG